MPGSSRRRVYEDFIEDERHSGASTGVLPNHNVLLQEEAGMRIIGGGKRKDCLRDRLQCRLENTSSKVLACTVIHNNMCLARRFVW